MKLSIIMLLLFLLNTQIVKSQTFSSVDQLSSYVGKKFSDLESGLSIKSNYKTTSLGIERRSYDFETYSVIVSESDDIKTIQEISIYTNKIKNIQEIWYNIVSEMNRNKKYEFIKSFVADRDDKITTNRLDYQQLITLLRKSFKSDEWIYEAKYKNKDTYYLISCSPVSVDIKIRNTPFEKQSYENEK
ncbi:hypothetical protein [Chryseobacterium sp. JV274]|uniref:hypothetical protein n=1 Tax=Chryseobacterium sp. JV274 TaxID=1932669 RepID=UPI0015C29AA2|nr:hypothetical protein [Chryseobacterium sp. JV274]CAD0220432.1 conserved exported protein of unknown function [Chryseobacterium sp. JV274]